MPFQIGNVIPQNNLILAPMAGVTTSAFRTLCLEHHAGIVYAEMVSDKGLIYQNVKTLQMIETSKVEHPIAMQLFGSSAETITQAAKLVMATSQIDILDINMGCPVQKVVKDGSGSALLKNPEKIYAIIQNLKETFAIPVTIKIRAGWDHQNINCDVVTKMACRAGVDAIAIHGRTRSQLYTGTCNLDYIKMVKEVATIPVIGNGDITDIASAQRMVEQTGVDAIMIGRSALGNPWIFDTLNAYFTNHLILDNPSKDTVIETLLLHANRLMALKGEQIAMIEMRTHAAWYLKLIPGTKTYRSAIVSIKTFAELTNICQAILTRLY